MRNVKLVIAYDGTDFHGWQTQPGLRTVQQDIESVLCRIVRHPVNLIASGRTDAGVHAVGQVANFFTTATMPSENLQHALGKRLENDVAIVSARDVPLGFHSTLSATSKMYRYRVHNARTKPVANLQHRYMYHFWKELDHAAMALAAKRFEGTHNFKAVASTRGYRRTYVRTIMKMTVERFDDEVRTEVQGSGFLYNQVRNMVGTLMEVGRGRWTADDIDNILASEDRGNAGPTSPPNGLSLVWVEYPPDEALTRRPPQDAVLPPGASITPTEDPTGS